MRFMRCRGGVNIKISARNNGTSANQMDRSYARHLPFRAELERNPQSLGGVMSIGNSNMAKPLELLSHRTAASGGRSVHGQPSRPKRKGSRFSSPLEICPDCRSA